MRWSLESTATGERESLHTLSLVSAARLSILVCASRELEVERPHPQPTHAPHTPTAHRTRARVSQSLTMREREEVVISQSESGEERVSAVG